VLHKKKEEAGDNSVVAVAFFRSVVLQCNKTSAATQCCFLRYAALQSTMYLVELRCKAAPQTKKQNKREKKK
jgi:hypothetical protein